MTISSVSGSNGTNFSVPGSNRQFGSVSEYSKALTNEYDFLTPSKYASVSISRNVLRQAMTNEGTAKWLEDNLNAIPGVIEKTVKAVNASGDRLDFMSLEITGEDEMTMMTVTTTDSPSPNDDLGKWLEKIRDSNREMTKEESQKVDGLMQKIKMVSTTEDSGPVSFLENPSAANSSNAIDYYA